MRRHILVAVAASAATVLIPGSAMAQGKLADLLPTLIQADVRLAPPPAGFPSHEAHFEPGVNQQLAPVLFNQQIVSQLATFPIGSSSGGFSYMFDPAAGTFSRATGTFGPAFAERALTNGAKKLTIGGNFQYSKYSSFEGTDLTSGDMKFFLTHQPETGAFFEGDLIQAALKLDLSSSTTTLFANYGLTNVWDVALAVPLVHVSMDATVDATVLRIASGTNSTIHQFVGGGTTATFKQSGSASGVGDILLRTKYRFMSTPAGGLAAGVDLRLPTGDANNLLGTGVAQATFMVIGSTTFNKYAPHINLGFSTSGKGTVVDIPGEVVYRFGTEYAWKPTATFTVDILGRTLRDAGRLELTNTQHPFTDAAGVAHVQALQEFVKTPGSLNLASIALGGKFNVKDNLLVSANLLVALTSAGVTARLTPVIGLDYSF